ncbi:MAG TPA: glutaminyl-peptide cyclotransferase [bacterium]|nr:glutaminyl-peptide cyclotransferase [bacterium]
MNPRTWVLLAVGAVLALEGGCAEPRQSGKQAAGAVYGCRVVHAYPHDPGAFTEGLIYRDGELLESTGLYGRSSLRRVKLETGEVLQSRSIAAQHFGEGLTDWDGRLIQLTLNSGFGFVYDLNTFAVVDTFGYSGAGWGLTHDRSQLIMSDGTPTLRFLDPVTFRETGHVTVMDGGVPVANLNELEYVKGEVYANVWQTDFIARIAPKSGRVTGWINLASLRALAGGDSADVLNGIAYDTHSDRLFVTGKLWPKLFEIQLVRAERISK